MTVACGRSDANGRPVRGSVGAAPVPDVEGLEASVGIVTLGDLDATTAGPLVAEAASQLGALLHR